jgi:hypothetical protein
MARELRVLKRMLNAEDPFTLDHAFTERSVPGNVADAGALLGFEPHTVGAHEANKRDAHPEVPLRDAGEPVETRFGGAAQQDECIERGHAFGFVSLCPRLQCRPRNETQEHPCANATCFRHPVTRQ